MKKIYTMLFAALAVCAVSCQEGPIDPQSPETETPDVVAPEDGQTMTFTASLPDTKVALDGLQPKWEAGDAITIYAQPYKNDRNEEIKPKAVFTTQDAGLTATFTGQVGDDFHGPYYAMYGHLGLNSILMEGKEISEVQIWKDQEIGNHYHAPMYAFSENTTLNFMNAGALLKFTVNAENVQSVKVVADAKISGDGAMYSNADFKIYNDESKAFNEVTLAGNFVNGETYHMVVAPTTIKSLKMYVNGGVYKSMNKELKIERSNIYNLGTIEEKVEVILRVEDTSRDHLQFWIPNMTPFIDGTQDKQAYEDKDSFRIWRTTIDTKYLGREAKVLSKIGAGWENKQTVDSDSFNIDTDMTFYVADFDGGKKQGKLTKK